MVKYKILVAVMLYIILGAIAYFNFGFRNLIVEKWGEMGGEKRTQ